MGMDVFRDQAGTLGLALFVGKEYHFLVNDNDEEFHSLVRQILRSPRRKSVYDMRKLQQLGVDPLEIENLFDIKILYGGDETLFQLAKSHLDDETYHELAERDQKFKSHIRACKTAQMDITSHSLLRLIPGRFIQTMFKLKCHVSLRLLEKKLKDEWLEVERYRKETHPLALTMMDIERNGIRVDMDHVNSKLVTNLTSHIRAFFLNVQHLERNGFVYTKFNVAGSKTGRLRVDSKEGRVFNPMGIPHGTARDTIISRFDGGKIVSLDYNAIDYRCIVASTDDESFRRKYENEPDFHTVNARLLAIRVEDPGVRDAVKAMTYVVLYGGSVETAARQAKVSVETVRKVIPILERELAPCIELREKLYEKSKRDGYVVLPNARKIFTEKGDHAGKVLGLYAQGYSSLRFELALMKISQLLKDRRTKVIFTVHDEIVLDEHPDEGEASHLAASAMEESEDGWPLVVHISKGRTYRDATE